MSEDILVANCAPTLAGLKTANMFSAEYESRDEVKLALRRLNAVLVPMGLRIVALRYMQQRVLLYLYRPDDLRRDLADSDAQEILRDCGYPCCCRSENCLTRLIARLRAGGDFPHEVGLFLGYPPEDVRGFIENRAGGCKLMGCWKVYGDVESAKEKFESYERCTRMCRGKSLAQIITEEYKT